MNRRFTAFNIVSVTLGFAFLYLPIVLLVIYSFNASKLVTVWGGFSTKWYGELLHDQAPARCRLGDAARRPHLGDASPRSSARSPPSRSSATAASRAARSSPA